MCQIPVGFHDLHDLVKSMGLLHETVREVQQIGHRDIFLIGLVAIVATIALSCTLIHLHTEQLRVNICIQLHLREEVNLWCQLHVENQSEVFKDDEVLVRILLQVQVPHVLHQTSVALVVVAHLLHQVVQAIQDLHVHTNGTVTFSWSPIFARLRALVFLVNMIGTEVLLRAILEDILNETQWMKCPYTEIMALTVIV